jgi:hypothetical protein
MSPVTPEFALSYRAAWAAHDSDAIVAIHTDDTVFAMHRLAEPPVGRHAVREAIAATIRGGLRCRSLHAVAANFPYSSPVTVGYVELRPDLLFAVEAAGFTSVSPVLWQANHADGGGGVGVGAVPQRTEAAFPPALDSSTGGHRA